MAGGEHRTRAAQETRCEVELIGGGQTDSDHVESLGAHSGGESAGEHRRALPHVVPDDHLLGALVPHQPGERPGDVGDELLVDLDADKSADVVGLDDAANRFGRPRRG